ncbi:MAG: GAF domain-containing protein, partial [candidate division Zixibacteria bacterium]|nr:GAF domain-containing protein [candidate division Zixibacteria bacterium]
TEGGEQVEYPSREADLEKRGKTEEIIFTREPILHKTKQEAEEWYAEPGHAEMVGLISPSWLGVPMIVGERVLGVIAVVDLDQEHAYDVLHKDILASMASQAAIALDNARLYKELEEKVVKLEKAQNRIAETEAALTRSLIASDFVHRMNNLAGTIPIWVRLIKEELNRDEFYNQDVLMLLNDIESDTNSLLRAAEKLNDTPIEQEVDVASVLQSMLRQIKIQYRGRIRVIDDISSQLHKIVALPQSLISALSSIVTNGVEAITCKGDGTLEVRANNTTDGFGNKWINLTFKDNGPGIKEENISKIFQPFFSTKDSGRGYGLWRAKTVINDLGGSIKVETQLGEGTCFEVRLPVMDKEE